MANQLTSNAEALRLFFTEDIYLVKNRIGSTLVEPVIEKIELPKQEVINIAMPKEEMVMENQPSLLAEEPKPELKKQWDFEYLGKNQQQILILVNDQINKVSTEKGTELLRKLVKAIELTNNDFALVNYASYDGAHYEDLSQFFNCQLVLSFGVSASDLGLAAQPLHQLYKMGETRMVFTANLHDLDSDQTSKKILWTTLQQLK